MTATVLSAYDFAQHDWDHDGATNPVCVTDSAEQLQVLQAGLEAGETWEATTDGGWPRVGWRTVLAVEVRPARGYVEPLPCFLLTSMYGGTEWHTFMMLSDIRRA